MNEHRPEDDDLGAALGDAIRSRAEADVVDLAANRPPLDQISARANERARRAKAVRSVGSVAAAAVLLVGGIVGAQRLRDDDTSISASEGGIADVAESDGDAEGADAAMADADSSGGATAAESTSPAVVDPDAVTITPESVSTAPVLEWIEIDVPFQAGSLQTLDDGRILALSWNFNTVGGAVWVTSDGENWEPFPTPEGVSPNRVIVEGDTIVLVADFGVAEEVAANFDEPAEYQTGLYVSDDAGTSWTRMELPQRSDAAEAGPFVRDDEFIGDIAVFGGTVVVSAEQHRWLDIEGLLLDRVGLDLYAEEELGRFGYGISYGSGQDGITVQTADGEELNYTYEELGLSDIEIAALDAETGTSRVYTAEPGEGLVERFSFEFSTGMFIEIGGELALTSYGESGITSYRSPDGVTWSVGPDVIDDAFEPPVVVGDVLWRQNWAIPFAIETSTDAGQTWTRTFEVDGLSALGSLSAGVDGLATTAQPITGGVFDEDTYEVEIPDVTATNGEFELRYNEPVGGMSVVEIATGDVRFVVSLEEADDVDPPPGIEVGPTGELTFTDLDTGEVITTFESEALDAAFAAEESALAEYAETGPYVPPIAWVGWSTNGADWGWETVVDAFGIDEDLEAWAQVAVGDGYVIASVETFPLYPELDSGAEFEAEGTVPVDPTAFEPMPQRWFIASTSS